MFLRLTLAIVTTLGFLINCAAQSDKTPASEIHKLFLQDQRDRGEAQGGAPRDPNARPCRPIK